MEMIVNENITYSNLFQEPIPNNVEILLNGIATKEVVMPHLCFINSLLYNEGEDPQNLNILNLALPELSQIEKDKLYGRLKLFSVNHIKFGIIYPKLFSSNTIFKFISYELMNSRESISGIQIKNWDLQILKAYIWFQIQEANEIAPILNDTKLPKEYEKMKFQWAAWPALVGQYEFMVKTDYTYKSSKVYLTFEFLMKNGYEIYCEEYLNKKGYKSIEEMLIDNSTILQLMYSNKRENYRIISSNKSTTLESLSINQNEFSNNENKRKDYIGIRETPLYSKNEHEYLVMSWGFIDNRFDLTYLFDFYSLTGINQKFSKFILFKNFCGIEIMEKIYFRKIIYHYFSDNQAKIEFDESSKIGFPDAYVRIENTVYLFEFKDAFMPVNISTCYNFKDIKNDIDKKFIQNDKGARKGITQLVHNIKSISNDPIKNDKFSHEKIFLNKIEVFPIIVYTHTLYTLPGINSYLNDEFKLKLIEEGIDEEAVKVHPLVMISLNFLVANQYYFSKGPMNLKETILEYSNRLHNRKIEYFAGDIKEIDKKDIVNNQFNFHISLEDEFKHELGAWTLKNFSNKNYINFSQYIGSIYLPNLLE